jgi:hypothetical protein
VFICTCASLCNLSNTCLYARVPLSATYQTRVYKHVCLSLQHNLSNTYLYARVPLSATYQTRVYMHVCLSLQRNLSNTCLYARVPLSATYQTRVSLLFRVGQNHIYTVYIRYFWLGNHQIYGVYIRIYTVLANPTLITSYVVIRYYVLTLFNTAAFLVILHRTCLAPLCCVCTLRHCSL